MNYRKLGNSELKVSPVGLGTWALGNDTFGKVEDSNSIKAIRAGIDSGINLIDTAPAYGAGHSEEVVGQAVKGLRDKVIIATKCGTYRRGEKYIRDLSPARIRKDIELSLKRLDTDYIDLYQIHWPDVNTSLEDSIIELVKLQNEGKFRYLGICNFGTELLDEVLEMTDIISLQVQYSLLERKIEDKIIPYVIDKDLGVLSYGTLGGGILSGKYKELPLLDDERDKRNGFYPFYNQESWSHLQELLNLIRDIAENYNRNPAQVVINWSINRRNITTALVGAKTDQQAIQNAAAVDWKLNEEDMQRLSSKSSQILLELNK